MGVAQRWHGGGTGCAWGWHRGGTGVARGAGEGTTGLSQCLRAGCRCPPGLFLQEGACVNASQCHCHLGLQRWLPGHVFLRDNCSQW